MLSVLKYPGNVFTTFLYRCLPTLCRSSDASTMFVLLAFWQTTTFVWPHTRGTGAQNGRCVQGELLIVNVL